MLFTVYLSLYSKDLVQILMIFTYPKYSQNNFSLLFDCWCLVDKARLFKIFYLYYLVYWDVRYCSTKKNYPTFMQMCHCFDISMFYIRYISIFASPTYVKKTSQPLNLTLAIFIDRHFFMA